MRAKRRDLFKWAAAGSAAALAGCAKQDAATPSDTVDVTTIAEAEKLFHLKYTAHERALMAKDFDAGLDWLAALRTAKFENTFPPATTFDPRTPRKHVGAQKNIVALGGAAPGPAPQNADDIAYASVAALGAWLRRKEITAAKLAEIYLKRIRAQGQKLKAFITVAEERALAEADAADKLFAKGTDKGPLQGIPYALIDVVDTKGVATSWGVKDYKDRTPDKDAEIVRKLSRAGAVLLGKSACGAICGGERWFGGVTRNPWNIEEGGAGASAGSAAAVAAGLAAFGVGVETQGGIISPAERCGVVGLRPTYGRVSRDGMMTLAWSLDKVGPICRAAEDAGLVLAALNGFDADDVGAGRVGFSYDGAAPISGLRVGFVEEWFKEGDAVDRAALDAVRALGITPTPFPWPKTDYSPLAEIVFVEGAAAFSEVTLADPKAAPIDAGPWPDIWRKARLISAVDYVTIDRLRRRLMAELSAAFENFDVLIGPHFAGGALLMSNCAGLPQLALRAGFADRPTRDFWDRASASGRPRRVPRGISLWADIFEERKLIALARALEGRLGVASERPAGL